MRRRTMIETRITYYCTDCDEEYTEASSIAVCKNHHEVSMCEECWWKCSVCDQIFCSECVECAKYTYRGDEYELNELDSYCYACIKDKKMDLHHFGDMTKEENIFIFGNREKATKLECRTCKEIITLTATVVEPGSGSGELLNEDKDDYKLKSHLASHDDIFVNKEDNDWPQKYWIVKKYYRVLI
jgi:hypothetical protein